MTKSCGRSNHARQTTSLILSLMLAFFASCTDSSSDSPGDRAVAALTLIRDGETDKLDDYVYSTDPKRREFILQLLATGCMNNGGVKSFSVEAEEVEEDTANVTVRWHYRMVDYSVVEDFPMKKVDGKWKLHLERIFGQDE